MIFSNIANADFLNEFYQKVVEYSEATYCEITESLIKDEYKYYITTYGQKELTAIIMLNQNFFQYIFGFFKMLDMYILLPAFNSLRSAIECERLLRIFITDKSFREEYVNNDNYKFDKTYERKFMQSRIVKDLDNQEKELRKKNKIPMNIILGNHFFTQESSLSRLHNELSKWSHSLNINQLSLLYKKDGKIKLSIENELNDFNVLFVKKYIEATYLLINEHSNMFYLQTFSKEYMSFSKEMISYYSKYITLFYKKE